MRDPDRIPLILAALERRWREDPDLRFGQMLRTVTGINLPIEVLGLEDGALLERIGPVTEEEKRYVAEEPAARRRGWREWTRRDIAE